ncbi:MAG: tripartite tricarboxylate transporter TctB family protein [Roseovarius sp.]|nr:tripartite tricarboxylate transporter TctB family protein [Roseovarius sp.]
MAKGSRIARSEGPSHKMVEASVTGLVGLFAVIVIIGSIKAGINWGAEGPRAGFFPFYIGVCILISTAINFVNLFREEKDGLFAEWGQLRQVLSVVIPTAIYVSSISFIGLYVASMVFIAYFMRRLGKYKWPIIAVIAIGMPVLTYIVFEKWFLVPLPKGLLEEWFNL